MAELVDALDLESNGVTRAGSIPVIRIVKPFSKVLNSYVMCDQNLFLITLDLKRTGKTFKKIGSI